MIAKRYVFPILLLISVNAWANTDVVIFDNGDRLTGEVKSLQRGLLRFKSDATGTISIEWDNVSYIQSDQNIQVETQEGLRFLGHLLRSEHPKSVTVETTSGPFELNAIRVVKMTPIEESATGRLDGQVQGGFNYAKATAVKQLNLGVELDYRTELRIFSLQSDSTISDSGESEASQRSNLNVDYRRLWPNRWLTVGSVKLSRNDELGVDLRASISAGGGRFILQSNTMNLLMEGGLAVSRENISGGFNDEDSLEAFGRLRWDWFTFDLPEIDLSSNVVVFPNLTDPGRLRGDLDLSFKWEFIDDLFWQLTLYTSYDNRPADPDAETSDYGVTTSLGWEF